MFASSYVTVNVFFTGDELVQGARRTSRRHVPDLPGYMLVMRAVRLADAPGNQGQDLGRDRRVSGWKIVAIERQNEKRADKSRPRASFSPRCAAAWHKQCPAGRLHLALLLRSSGTPWLICRGVVYFLSPAFVRPVTWTTNTEVIFPTGAVARTTYCFLRQDDPRREFGEDLLLLATRPPWHRCGS